MTDPREVYRQGSEHQRSLLLKIWPAMHAAVAPSNDEAEPARNVLCVIGSCPFTRPRPVAVGRLTRNGHPACRAHIAKLANRLGGWPLERQEGPS
jgi:hypothetical protein